MSHTLARRIRRIGLLPTTYTEVTETRLVTVRDEETGETHEETLEVKLKKPVRNRERLTLEQLTQRRNAIITAVRAKRKGTAPKQ